MQKIFFLGMLVLLFQAQSFAEESSEVAVNEPVVESVEVISFSGTVEVRLAEEGEYKAAEEGMLLTSGTTISTSSGATAELGFDENDENIVRVEENTTAIILFQGNEKIQLLEGEVFSLIHNIPAGTSFEIRTPTAVIGARGTEWATKYKNETTEVEAFEDNPFVKAVDDAGQVNPEETIVTSGYSTEIKRHQRPTTLRPVPEKRQQKWQQVRGDVKQRTKEIREKRGSPRIRQPQPGNAQPGGQRGGKELQERRPGENFPGKERSNGQGPDQELPPGIENRGMQPGDAQGQEQRERNQKPENMGPDNKSPDDQIPVKRGDGNQGSDLGVRPNEGSPLQAGDGYSPNMQPQKNDGLGSTDRPMPEPEKKAQQKEEIPTPPKLIQERSEIGRMVVPIPAKAKDHKKEKPMASRAKDLKMILRNSK